MAGKRAHRRAAVLVATVATLLCGGLAAMSPAAAEGRLTVVWPVVTEFNPETTDYPIDVRYTGSDHLS